MIPLRNQVGNHSLGALSCTNVIKTVYILFIIMKAYLKISRSIDRSRKFCTSRIHGCAVPYVHGTQRGVLVVQRRTFKQMEIEVHKYRELRGKGTTPTTLLCTTLTLQ